MTTITVDIIFITAPVDLGATIHAATPIDYEYNTLCGRHYKHDTPVYRFQEGGKTLADVCEDCRDRMEGLGMPTDGRAINELGMVLSEPDLLRAVQHLFEAARHITGYTTLCPVCGGTQQDGDEGCRLCEPLFKLKETVQTINGYANTILLIEDPFEGLP